MKKKTMVQSLVEQGKLEEARTAKEDLKICRNSLTF